MSPLLELDKVTVAAGDTLICRDVELTIDEGECHLLLGPNGSGKSSLLNALMGVKPFRIVSGRALLRGKDLTGLPVDERARAGLGLAYQRPPRLSGVTVEHLARAMGAQDRLAEAADRLGLRSLLGRDVNCGFSGGETKRWEVLKIDLQGPSVCLFDEPESGVDLEQVAVVGRAVNRLLASPDAAGRARGGLIITHTGLILDSLAAQRAHLMVDGRIVSSGDPRELFDAIRRTGYQAA